jgi:hypothetical protein
MKKIFAILLVLMLWTMPLVAFAEEAPVATEEVEATTTEGETTPPKTEINWGELKDTISAKVVNWIYENYDKALVSLFLLFSAIYDRARNKKLNSSMTTLNNNAVTVARSSTDFMGNALTEMKNASGAVVQYDTRITEMLNAFAQVLNDRASLEKELVETKNYLKISSEANMEFANELAELLGLANIPNYKKEELGARHLAFVNALKEAETRAEAEADAAAKMLLPAATPEEVMADVGEEP